MAYSIPSELAESSLILQLLTWKNVFGGLIAYFLVTILISFIRSPRLPRSLPLVGEGKSALTAFTNIGNWIQDGYEKYNKNGKTFIAPATIGSSHEIILPPSQMQWMVDQPDHVLSTSDAHYETLHGDYSFLEPILLQDPYHEHVIHRSLARNLNALIPDLDDEVRTDMDNVLGHDTEWKNVNLMGMLLDIIPKITNRMLVGKPVCQNQDYLNNMLAITNDIVRNMMIFAVVPKSLKGVVGPVAALANSYHYWRTTKYTLPLVKQRLADIAKKDAGDPDYKNWEAPNDYLTWHIKLAQAEGRNDELTPKRLTQRLIPLNFASIHTTALTGHSSLLDIFSTNDEVVNSLREEAERIWNEDGQQWSKAGLSRMLRIDSAIRESMRVNIFAKTLSQRIVVAKKGVTNEKEGWHAPKGTMISCPVWGVQHDEDVYQNPNTFDAFRYSREREEYESNSEKDSEKALKLKRMGMVTTSPQHFPFGHGRHACPGRFFVSHELKMVIAHLLLNFDVKIQPERPQGKWVGKMFVPPTEACIDIRRRKI